MNPVFKPYLLRAFFEWVMDEGWTPHISVVTDKYTQVPQNYVKEGRIILNVSPSACRNFFIHNDGVAFEARFNGVANSIWVPITRIESVFAREVDEGITFEVLETLDVAPHVEKTATKVRPTLKIVK
jgi:stringent starvation protein B